MEGVFATAKSLICGREGCSVKTTVYEQPAVEQLDQLKQFDEAHPMTALRGKAVI